MKGEGQGDVGTLEEVRALKGDGERCLRLGLKAAGVLLSSWLRPRLALAGVFSMLEGSTAHSGERWGRPLWNCEPWRSCCLDVGTKKGRTNEYCTDSTYILGDQW